MINVIMNYLNIIHEQWIPGIIPQGLIFGSDTEQLYPICFSEFNTERSMY